MQASGIIAAMIVVLLGCAACDRDDSPSAEQRATELSADQPLSPTPEPIPEQGQPETPAQTERDVAAAEQQAEEARDQVSMASDVTEAQAAHQIQIQKCEALASAERDACVAKADRELQLAKEREKKELERQTR